MEPGPGCGQRRWFRQPPCTNTVSGEGYTLSTDLGYCLESRDVRGSTRREVFYDPATRTCVLKLWPPLPPKLENRIWDIVDPEPGLRPDAR